jgi:hypothetical protein
MDTTELAAKYLRELRASAGDSPIADRRKLIAYNTPMANGKPKLELTWIGKDIRPKLEPRLPAEEGTALKHFRYNDERREEPDPQRAIPRHGDESSGKNAPTWEEKECVKSDV